MRPGPLESAGSLYPDAVTSPAPLGADGAAAAAGADDVGTLAGTDDLPGTDRAGPFAGTEAAALRVPQPGENEPSRGRTGHRWLTAALVTAFVVVLGLGGYLAVATRQWQDSSTAWEDRARSGADQLADVQTRLDQSRAALAEVSSQLSAAQERITQLADEKAQLGDDRELQRQLVDYQQRVTAAAGKVASALTACIGGQDQLIGYLQDAAAYDPTDLARFSSQVQDLCRSATDANAQLQQELSP